MTQRIRLVALAILILVCAPAQPTALAQDASSVSGRVVDAASHKPVSGAKIDLFADAPSSKGANALEVTLSRKDGGFQLMGVPAGQYRVEITKMGYAVQVLSGLLVQEREHVIVGEPIALVMASADDVEKMACNTVVRPDEVADVYVVCSRR